MQSPATLLNEIVDLLKSIPELVGVHIESFLAQSEVIKNPDEAVDNMQYSTGILAIYESGEFPRSGETRGMRHNFMLVLKCQGNHTVGGNLGYFDLLAAIYDGIPAAPAGNDFWKFCESY